MRLHPALREKRHRSVFLSSPSFPLAFSQLHFTERRKEPLQVHPWRISPSYWCVRLILNSTMSCEKTSDGLAGLNTLLRSLCGAVDIFKRFPNISISGSLVRRVACRSDVMWLLASQHPFKAYRENRQTKFRYGCSFNYSFLHAWVVNAGEIGEQRARFSWVCTPQTPRELLFMLNYLHKHYWPND